MDTADRHKTRNKAKQAEKKGVVVREVPFDDELARGIWEIYNECPVRQERLFPHYGKSLEAVREMSATFLDESSVFIGAFDGNKLIGFIKLTIDDTRTQAGMMHIISMLPAPGQGADECTGRASSSFLCRSTYSSSGVREICLWEEACRAA